MSEAQGNNSGQGTPTPEQVFDESYQAYDTAYSAWQAEPDNEELKTVFETTRAKTKESISAWKEDVRTKLTPPALPDKYELKLPDNSLLDPSTIERISTYAKEKGLSNEAAQEVLNRENAAVTAYHEAQNQQVTEIRNAWVKEAEADKEIGGDKFKENLSLAKRVVDRFGSEAFKTALNETGFGNHPEVIRTFARIGLLMADDKLVTSGQSSGGTKTMEETFYGKQN